MSSKNEKKILQEFITENELHFTPEVRPRLLERVSLWSKGRNGIEWGCALLGSFRDFGDKAMPVVDDFIDLPAYNTANRQHMIQINVDDFERIRRLKKNVIGFLHTHPQKDLTPSMEDWSLFSYLYAMDPVNNILFVIMDPDGTFAVFDFRVCSLYPRSYVDLFRRVKENAKKQNQKERALDGPDPGEV